MTARCDLPWRAGLTPDAPRSRRQREPGACHRSTGRAAGLPTSRPRHRPTARRSGCCSRVARSSRRGSTPSGSPVARCCPQPAAHCRRARPQLADARVGWLLGEAGDARLDELVAQVPGLRAEAAPGLVTLPSPRRTLPGERGGWCRRLVRRAVHLRHVRAREGRLPEPGELPGQRGGGRGSARRRGRRAMARLHAAVPRRRAVHPDASLRFGGPVRLLPRFDAAAVSDALDRATSPPCRWSHHAVAAARVPRWACGAARSPCPAAGRRGCGTGSLSRALAAATRSARRTASPRPPLRSRPRRRRRPARRTRGRWSPCAAPSCGSCSTAATRHPGRRARSSCGGRP